MYAEYLPNINQISIHVSLASAISDQTTIELDHGCNSIILRHRGDRVSAILPFKVAPNTTVQTPPLERHSKYFSLRLGAERIDKPVIQSAEEEMPWAAETLDSLSDFVCRSCKDAVVFGHLKLWRNLPSEHWAEMMDFWHCHKPMSEIGSSLAEEDKSKAYAASNRLTVRKGIGLVNTLYFVISPQDCPNSKVSLTRNLLRSFVRFKSTDLILTGGKKATCSDYIYPHEHRHRYNSPRLIQIGTFIV